MAESTHWGFPRELQPKSHEVRFDLAQALDSVVALRAEIPEDAFTAAILGTERVGNGVVIRDDGLVLTIGYLIVEAESVWLTANDGAVVAGHPLAYDFATGFGLVQPLGEFSRPALARGSSAATAPGDEVIAIGQGGRAHALKTQVFAKREFAGPWEYLIDDALFTTPPHPEWSGAALVGDDGRLVGIGSLFVQEPSGEETVKANMFVPIDLLEPSLPDLLQRGRPPGLPRPWLGMYTAQMHEGLVVSGLAEGGPADRAGVEQGDHVIEVAGERVVDLADFFRKVWGQGPAGTEIRLTLARDGAPAKVLVQSADRMDFLKKPRLQ
jgi:S1-C subfamily serine protease